MANSVVLFSSVARCVTHTPTLSPPLGRKPACVNACSRGGVSPSCRLDGEVAVRGVRGDCEIRAAYPHVDSVRSDDDDCVAM